jgi:hypothetical protein
VLTALGAGMTGCSVQSSPSGQTTGTDDSSSRVTQVESALAQPTGVVASTTMTELNANYWSFDAARAIFASALLIDSDAASACLTGAAAGGSYDLGCTSNGDMVGTMTFAATRPGLIDVTFDQACGGGMCVNGTMELKESVAGDPAMATLAVEADVQHGRSQYHLQFGHLGEMADGSLTGRTVFFDAAGASYVVDPTMQMAGVNYSYGVLGANGTFECTYGLSSSSCTGAGTFTF